MVATQIFLEFSPRSLGKMNPIWRPHIFQKGLVETTNQFHFEKGVFTYMNHKNQPSMDRLIFPFFSMDPIWELNQSDFRKLSKSTPSLGSDDLRPDRSGVERFGVVFRWVPYDRYTWGYHGVVTPITGWWFQRFFMFIPIWGFQFD